MASRWDSISVDGGDMRCYVSAPEGAGPWPVVIVIQHAGGVDDFVQAMSDRFADAGFLALAPDLYHRDPSDEDNPMARMGRLRDPSIVADVSAAVEHVRTLDVAAADRIGITGFCMGGRVAYLMATHLPELKAAVVFYGGNILVPWGEAPAPFERSESIRCPVLGLFGADDPNPSPEDVAKIDAELSRHGVAHEFHSYAGAGHAFMNEGRPSYREDAAADAWERCLAWFRRHL
jgi:carboxymethylenebutenolidase